MAPNCRVFAAPKDSNRAARLALTLVLVTCSLLWEACSAVQNGQNSSNSSSPSQSTHTIVLPAATVGMSYLQTLTVGTQILPAVIVGQLPPGLTLNPKNATVAGVPTQAGTFTFTVKNFENAGTMDTVVQKSTVSNYAITVGSPASEVSVQVSAPELSVAPGGKLQFTAIVKNTSNTGVTWSASTGSISATGLLTAPTVSGIKSVTVTATSTAEAAAHSSLAVTITSQTFRIATTSLPSGMQSTPYSVSLTGSGGQTPYQWSIISGSLPAGLQLNQSTGMLSGTTAIAGTFTIAIQSEDAAGQVAEDSFSLVIQSSGQSSCGPPSYPCSRTDSAIVQIPHTLPNVGNLTGANTIVTDPDFGNRIVRVTDWNTDPSQESSNRSYVSAASGSADENLWNTNSTMFVLQNLGAASYTYTFDPNTMQAQRMYVSSDSARAGFTFSGDGMWSRVSPTLLYTAGEPAPTISSYDFSDASTPPTPQLVYNFTSSPNCLPANFAAIWKSKGGVSAGDTTFGMGYSNTGNQGTGVYAVAYRVGSGCTVLNTKTGQVWGDWGAKGTINIPDRWSIHNVKISKDGNWLIIAKTTCFSSSCSAGPYFWQVGTTNVSSCGDGLSGGQACSGHWTEGYTHWMNNYDAGKFTTRPLAEPTSIFYVTPNPPAGVQNPLDQHASWNNADPEDSYPFFLTFWSPTFPFPGPWYDEITGVSPDGSKVWRFAHSFITTKSQVFSTEYGIGSVSQDGRFFVFSSDWMGTLGGQSGTASCTVGSDCRGDVFVLQLN